MHCKWKKPQFAICRESIRKEEFDIMYNININFDKFCDSDIWHIISRNTNNMQGTFCMYHIPTLYNL